MLGIDRWQEAKWKSLERQVATDPPPEQVAGEVRPRSAPSEKRKSNWLGGRDGDGRWFR
jgi:hypothetical protein